MAATAVVGLFLLTSVVRAPAGVIADDRVGEVVLVEIVGHAGLAWRVGDNVAVQSDKARLPVVTADHVQDVIPGIAHGKFGDLREGVIRRLAIDDRVQLPGMSGSDEDIINAFMTCLAGLAADVLSTGQGLSAWSGWPGGSGRSSRSGGALGSWLPGTGAKEHGNGYGKTYQ